MSNNWKTLGWTRFEDRLADHGDKETIRHRCERLLNVAPSALDYFTSGTEYAQEALLSLLVLGDAAIEEVIRFPYLLSSLLTPGVIERPFSDNPDPRFRLLQFKRLSWLKIVVRDKMNLVPFTETLHDFSDLADTVAIKGLQRTGVQPDELSLWAMGKWGAFELNASSDIDPIFFSSEKTLPERSSSLVQQWSQTLLEEKGQVIYPVDLRLRPEGKAGPLASSYRSVERYFSNRAAPWERIAYSRARVVYGEVPGWFEEVLFTFLYPLGFNPLNRLSEVAGMLETIRNSAKQRDIKRSPGGIRDVEFLCAALVLADKPDGYQRRPESVEQILLRMKAENQLSEERADYLLDDYLYLRRVEHFLQVEEDRPRFVVPEQGSSAHSRLAFLMDSCSVDFESDLMRRIDRIKMAVDEELIQEQGQFVTTSVFVDPQQDEGTDESDSLNEDHLTQRSRAIIRRLTGPWGGLDALIDIEQLLQAPNLEEAMVRIESSVSAYGGASAWATAFSKRKAIQTSITRLAIFGELLIQEAVKRPYLFERVGANVCGLPERADTFKREYKKVVGDFLFHGGEQYLSDSINQNEFFSCWNQVIDDVMRLCLEQVFGEHYDHIALIAVGKWGGTELAPGGDLDFFLVVDNSYSTELAELQELALKWLSIASLDGTLELDARLRPEGAGSPMVVTEDRLKDYLNNRAQAWEKIALARARLVAGNQELGNRLVDLVRAFSIQPPPATKWPDLHRARKKAGTVKRPNPSIVRFKKGRGGMMDYEFASHFAGWSFKVQDGNFWSAPIGRRFEMLHDWLSSCEIEPPTQKVSDEFAGMISSASKAYYILRRWEILLRFAGFRKANELNLKNNTLRLFYHQLRLDEESLKKEWGRIAGLGRGLYDLLADQFV